MQTVAERAVVPFGLWVEGEFIARGLNQAAFARLIKVSDNTVSHWVNKGGVPKRATCYAIADALGLPVDVVLDRAGYGNPFYLPAEPIRPTVTFRDRTPEDDERRDAALARAERLMRELAETIAELRVTGTAVDPDREQ